MRSARRERQDSATPEFSRRTARRCSESVDLRDKYYSLHAYGLAVDMHGIGRPGSAEAQQWHEIAARHGIVCPYGYRNRAEWNHCQPTHLVAVKAENPLRDTIVASGPIDLERMFETGTRFIADAKSALTSVIADRSAAVVRAVTSRLNSVRQPARTAQRNARSARHVKAARANTRVSRPAYKRTPPTRSQGRHDGETAESERRGRLMDVADR